MQDDDNRGALDTELVDLGSVSGNRGCGIFTWIFFALFVALIGAGVWWAVS